MPACQSRRAQSLTGRAALVFDLLASQLVNPRGPARLRRSVPTGSIVDLARGVRTLLRRRITRTARQDRARRVGRG